MVEQELEVGHGEGKVDVDDEKLPVKDGRLKWSVEDCLAICPKNYRHPMLHCVALAGAGVKTMALGGSLEGERLRREGPKALKGPRRGVRARAGRRAGGSATMW